MDVMKEMKKYCIGKNTKFIYYYIIVLSFVLIVVFFLRSGVNISDIYTMAESIARPILFFIIVTVAASFVMKALVGNSKKRFEKRIAEFQSKGVLNDVLNDFQNALLFFKNDHAKIGKYCIFIKGEGLILLYNDISSVRLNIDKVTYESGGGNDYYVVQVCAGGKYYNLGQLKTGANDPQLPQFINFIRLKAPHILIENNPHITHRHIDDTPSDNSSDDD